MNVRFDVPHDGKPKMVGKLFEHGGRHYFLHEVRKDSQAHRKFDAPGGIDVVVIDKLKALSPVIGEVVIIHRNPSATWTTTPEMVERCGLRALQGGRDRYFLHWDFWEKTPTRITLNPHCAPIVILDTRVSWAPIVPPAKATSEAPSPQGSLTL